MITYICTDVLSENDESRCKHSGVKYNQCCQDCNHKEECKDKCDYSDNCGCIAIAKET